MITRRNLLKLGAVTGAGLASSLGWLSRLPAAHARNPLAKPNPAFTPASGLEFVQSANLTKFIQPLRVPGTGIPIAAKDTPAQPWWQPGVDHYTIDMAQFEDQLHPELPNPTRLWGYGQGATFKHLGGIVAAKRDTPVQITFRNNLPATHIIPVDETIMGVMGNQNNRAAVHLHGGFSPWFADGGPLAWWDPNGHQGASFLNNQVLRAGNPAAANEAEYYFPNHQSSRLMWYHDHAFGITRINAYAGLASAYVLYDDYELSLVSAHNLPGPLDPRTVYLVFQDKVFVPADIATKDPTWATVMPASRPGDLWYAHEYDPLLWELAPGGLPLPNPSAIPEFFGDTVLVNGSVYPYLDVEPRQYRFRMLNACNARFLNPRLVYAAGATPPDSTEPSNAIGPAFIQIGTEGGFLPQPTMVNGPLQSRLLLAPAERADLIVDFRGIPAGTILLLYSDTPAPFPGGNDVFDYYPGNPYNPTLTPAGKGPNTRTLLQIRVNALTGTADEPITLPAAFTPTDPFLVTQIPGVPTPIPAGVRVRYLTLNEGFDSYGRLIQFLGTDTEASPGVFGREYQSGTTELVAEGSTEVWEILNISMDTHPIHFHLVNVQVLSRQAFDDMGYTGGAPTYTQPPSAPELNELGWKETVRMNPQEVTRVIMKFDLPETPFPVPLSPSTGGHEYVWHCHILEHEEHDMMRPLVVTPKIYLPFAAKGA